LEIENKISNISTQIIELKKASTETNDLETQIDTLVYKIFGLTEKEIKIIEGT
jgi:flagellar hook-associated protein FlgK